MNSGGIRRAVFAFGAHSLPRNFSVAGLDYLHSVVLTDEQVRQLLSWSAPAEAKPTLYANSGPALLDVTPANADRMPLPMPYDAEKWLAFTRERAAAPPFVRVRFAAAAPARAQPADYAPRLLDPDPPPGAADCGAPTDRLPPAADPAPAGASE